MDAYVYAGTALEEGELTICVKANPAVPPVMSSIVTDDRGFGEAEIASVEGKAAAPGRRSWFRGAWAVPRLTWLLTRNVDESTVDPDG